MRIKPAPSLLSSSQHSPSRRSLGLSLATSAPSFSKCLPFPSKPSHRYPLPPPFSNRACKPPRDVGKVHQTANTLPAGFSVGPVLSLYSSFFASWLNVAFAGVLLELGAEEQERGFQEHRGRCLERQTPMRSRRCGYRHLEFVRSG
ncbi:hypothetical protein CC80DRAFT_539034, partial [Byssothecium circinans]